MIKNQQIKNKARLQTILLDKMNVLLLRKFFD